MIDRQEIMEHADGFGLGANIIEKDYVLGWLLAGISGHPDAFPNWIFKGGTCLRKCHLETYRFSEDLDFTVTERSQIDKRFLTRVLNEVSEWVFEHAGIEMPRETITVKIAASRKSRIAAQGRVGYRGPMRRRRGGVPRIKLDLNGGEILVQEPVARSVNHPYTDSPERGICIRSYSFGEMFAEKVRALADRESPRDLYDVVHLYRRGDLGSDRLLSILTRKCSHSGIDVPDMATFKMRKKQVDMEHEWREMLKHQLPVLPPLARFQDTLLAALGWLHGAFGKTVQEPMPIASGGLDEDWRPPSMLSAWDVKVPLEAIRFAAANHLCVGVTYKGDRLSVEPYSLRRARDGNLVLFAVDRETGNIHSCDVNRIKDVEVSGESFAPRYAIDITPNQPR